MSRVLRAIPLGKIRGLLNAAFRTPAYPGDAVVTLQTPATLLRRRVCRCGLLDERAGLYRPSRSSGLAPRFKYFRHRRLSWGAMFSKELPLILPMHERKERTGGENCRTSTHRWPAIRSAVRARVSLSRLQIRSRQ